MPVFESSRKVLIFGSSLGLTLPAMFVKASEIEKGSVMGILYSLEGVMVVSLVEDPEAIKQCLKAIMGKLDSKISEQSQNDRAGDAK